MAELGASDFMPGFTLIDVEVSPGIIIRAAKGGDGPPLLLLHGHPETHIAWRHVAPALTDAFSVVAPDLRGYGDSSKPEGGENHCNYAKRAMAEDQVRLMRALGHHSFGVVGHDRGGRVAHRMALDFPDAVERLAVLDIAPTATMYARTNMEFARRYFWWFFLIQPYPLPEEMIAGNVEGFLREHLARQAAQPNVFPEDVIQEYLRCYRDPATCHAICEDYRAGATIDLEHDKASGDSRVTAPLLALWGAKGTVGALYDVLQTWREKAIKVEGHALNCGHALPAEAPQNLIDEIRRFFPAAPLIQTS